MLWSKSRSDLRQDGRAAFLHSKVMLFDGARAACPLLLGGILQKRGCLPILLIWSISGKEITVLPEVGMLSEASDFWGVLFKAPSHGSKRHCEKFSFNLIFFISYYKPLCLQKKAQNQMWVHPQGSDTGRQIKRTQSLSSLNQVWVSLENWCYNSKRSYGLDAEIISGGFLSCIMQEVRLQDDNSPSRPQTYESFSWVFRNCPQIVLLCVYTQRSRFSVVFRHLTPGMDFSGENKGILAPP